MTAETHIGQYKILRTLGAGGMGTVYLGEHILLGRRAAIKTLLPSLSSHREIVERFFNEARAISAISDPGVVQIFDFGYHVDGTAYIVMEFLEGESLATRIDRLGKLSLVECLRLTRQIASSLGAAHARGIIHRDLKPGNVFVIRDTEVQGGERTKILDFGIAKLASNSEQLHIVQASTTQTGAMLGTPIYMSPEQCRGAGQADHRSDIYSVGAALFHMLTGRPPFDCDSVGDYIAAHLREPAPKPSDFAPELPPAVDALLELCLAKRPDERFQSMAELQSAIEDVLANLSDADRVVVPPPLAQVPLGEGFNSDYDANRRSRPSTNQGPRPSAGWFVDSQASVPPGTDDVDDHEWLPPEKGMSTLQRIALVGALFVGLVGGIAGASYFLDDGEEPATAPQAPVAESQDDDRAIPPATASQNEPAPPAPVAEDIAPDAGVPGAEPPKVPDEVADDVQRSTTEPTATFTQDAPVTKAKAKKKKQERPRAVRRPQPRRPAPPVEREPQPEDDLYDTR